MSTSVMKRAMFAGTGLMIVPAFLAASPQVSSSKTSGEPRYLAFQIFTGGPNPEVAIGDSGFKPLGAIPSERALTTSVVDISTRIGLVGRKQSRLAVIYGPLAFDHSDTEVRRLISSGFRIALKTNVAVGFHLDDSMFWARRTDLLRNPKNIEWMDWKGTPSTARRIDWGPEPQKLPPQMCMNSEVIQAEVRRRSKEVIGKAIKSGLDELKRQGKQDLFAGVIVGWETQIGQDFPTGRYLGYHALANRGYSAKHPPRDLDFEREEVVEQFITLWCKGIASAGISPQKIYSHTAFFPKRLYKAEPFKVISYSQHNHFAPPRVAFGESRRPGFSTYPQPGLFDQIYGEVAARGRQGWASSEGTNLEIGSGPGQSGMNMETYLAKMFNHGATLVNIFSWGVGGEANKKMDFRLVTEGDEALRAYRKFLRGEPLVERAEASTLMERLPAKIHRIQKELPVWIERTHRQAVAQPLLERLDKAMKANDFVEAEKVADAILELIVSR